MRVDRSDRPDEQPAAQPHVQVTAKGHTWSTFFSQTLAALIKGIRGLFRARSVAAAPLNEHTVIRATARDKVGQVAQTVFVGRAGDMQAAKEMLKTSLSADTVKGDEKSRAGELLRKLDRATEKDLPGLWRSAIREIFRNNKQELKILLPAYKTFTNEDPRTFLAEILLIQESLRMQTDMLNPHAKKQIDKVLKSFKEKKMSDLEREVAALSKSMPHNEGLKRVAEVLSKGMYD